MKIKMLEVFKIIKCKMSFRRSLRLRNLIFFVQKISPGDYPFYGSRNDSSPRESIGRSDCPKNSFGEKSKVNRARILLMISDIKIVKTNYKYLGDLLNAEVC